MAVTIKTGAMKYKNGGGEYVSFNAVASETEATQIANINSAGAAQISAIETKGAQTKDTIPDDYTSLQNDVDDLKSAVEIYGDGILSQERLTGTKVNYRYKENEKMEEAEGYNAAVLYDVTGLEIVQLQTGSSKYFNVYTFLDTNNTVLKYVQEDGTVDTYDLKLLVPENATQLLASCGNSNVNNVVCYNLNADVRSDINNVSKTVNNLVPDALAVRNNYNIGFNHFDGRFIENYAWTANMSMSTGGVYDSTAVSTYPIPVGSTTHLRFRSNQLPIRVFSYDSTGAFVKASNWSAYAIDFVQNGYVIFSYLKTNFDPSTLMIAYTDETSGATSNTWSSLFSGKAYEPYTLIPKNGMLTNDMFVDQVIGLAGVAISTDTYTGEKIVTIPASKEKQIFIPCEQMTCYLLEFYGKSNYVEFSSDYSKGAMLILEFTDGNYRVIGKITDSSASNYGQLYKYNGCVLGKDARRYHRYGAVSPRGAKYIKLRVVTRTDTTIELSNVSLRPVHGYNGRQQNGIKIDGHLGCILTSPRNTMPSFEQAKIAGYNTVICNVKFTGDNPPIPVCIHNDTIDATSDGTGEVSSYTYEQLQAYDFGSYFDPVYTGTRIPKFEDVLAYFSSNGIRPAISIHSNQTSETLLDIIADLFKKHSVHNALIKSFNMSILSYMFSKLGDDAEYIWDFDLATPTEQNMTALANIGAKRACVETSYDYCTQESINMAHAKGLEYSVSFPYDPAQIRELALRGIDRVCMDFFSDISIPMN